MDGMTDKCDRCGMEFTERCQMEGATQVEFLPLADGYNGYRQDFLCWNCKHEAYRIWTKFMSNRRNAPDDRTIQQKDADEEKFINGE